MKNRDITRLVMVKGATVLRQGHFDTLAFTPRNAEGEDVDLTGKTINVKIIGQMGIVYETPGSFNSTDRTLQFSISKNIGHGEMWMEITVTDPADATYRQKFPTSEYEGKLFFIRSSDDLDYVGFSGKTVAQFEAAQTEFTNKMQQDFDVAVAAVTQDSEVALARMGEASLRAFNQKTTEKLAETGKQPAVMTSFRNQGSSGAAITFVDDDGTAQVWDVLRPFIQEMDIPYVLAIPPGARDSFPTMISLEQMKIMQDDYNCEIAAHSLTHPTFQELTEEQKIYEFTESKRILTQAGLKVQNFVFPYGSGFEESTQRLCTQYFNCGVSASGGLNVKPVRSMDLGRIAIGSFLSGNNDGTFAYYKTKIDEAIAKGGWLIFMTHVNVPSHDAAVYQVMRDIINYARTNSVDILNLQDGYERYGNVVEIPGRLTIQNDGKIVKDNFDNVSIAAQSGITANSPITAFTRNKVSINHFNLSSGSGFPQSDAGTAETYHINDYSTSYQVWKPFIDAGSVAPPTFYYRRAMSATTWGPFKRMTVGEKVVVSATLGTIQAGKVVVADIAVTNVSNTDNITISPGFGMPAELIYSVKRVNSTLLRLAVFNPTTVDFTVSSTSWNLSITN